MRLLGSDGQVTKRLHYPAPKNLGLSPELLAEIKDGLIKAAHDANGTSSAIFGNFTPDRGRQDRHRRGACPTIPTPGTPRSRPPTIPGWWWSR